MAHNLATDDVVAFESLDIFENELVVSKHTTRKYEKIFGQQGNTSNRGDTIGVRKPNYAEVHRGWASQYPEIDEDTVPLTIDMPMNHSRRITDKEMSMDITEAREQIIQPALNALAHEWDSFVIEKLIQSPNYVGAPGTTPTALSTYINGRAILLDYACPDDGNIMVAFSPQMEVELFDALKGLPNDEKVVGQQYKTAKIRNVAGLAWGMTQQLQTHLTGANTGAGLVKGASQSGGSILLDDFTVSSTGVAKRNDILAFPGCYAINPVTHRSTGRLKTFRVVNDADSDGSGEATVYIDPPIYTSGPKQNVSASPDNDGGVLLFGHASSYASTTARQGFMWHKSAVAIAFQRLENPQGEGAKGRAVTDEKLGMSVRYSRSWDIDSSLWKLKWEIFGGAALLRPEWTLRIQSGS